VWHSPKILVVDDEVRICESFAYLLAARNYDVDTATCGHDALSLLEDKRFDLAVLDVHLPDMMGTGVMEKVKLKSPDTVVIIITGDADLDSALTALKFGAYDYLRKPFEVEELLKTVENALNQRKLKREKDQINAKLCLSEQKYRYLVQNSPDLIYTLDHKGNFTFLSSTVEHFLGFTAEELIGKHYSTIVCEEDLGKAQWFFDERRSRERATSGIELRLKVAGGAIRKNGGSRFLPVELKSMGIHEVSKCEGDRRHVGTHGVIRDISERQRLQVQLQNAERMESLGTLAGGIAHDFNNLLMGIQGRTSLISMDLDAPHPHMEHLHAIDEYIRSATDLTKQLLGFARGGKYEVKPTDINGLIFKSLNMFARAKKEIIVETKFSNANIIVEIDRGQIEQVMLNLYVNAWQAMPEGGTLHLTTEAVVLDQAFCSPNQLSPGAYARVAVTDTGVGMDHNTQRQIFDPFFTTKDKSRGTGLGLASAYGIVKNHGGIINVQSQIGRGTTFNLFLPISDKPATKERVLDSQIANGSETILLVDDEEMIIDVGQALLKRLGYKVIAVNSGGEAVDAIQRMGSDIDLVILDMIMPGMDGGKTFDRIREISPRLPVMLSSGYAINDQATKIMRRGCNGFIQKPFSVSELSKKIREIFHTQNPFIK
jgi:two-component system cell cycle sensor histidine kinase/response regulator CckA